MRAPCQDRRTLRQQRRQVQPRGKILGVFLGSRRAIARPGWCEPSGSTGAGYSTTPGTARRARSSRVACVPGGDHDKRVDVLRLQPGSGLDGVAGWMWPAGRDRLRGASVAVSTPARRARTARSVPGPSPDTSSHRAWPLASRRKAVSTRSAPPVSATTPSARDAAGSARSATRMNQPRPATQPTSRASALHPRMPARLRPRLRCEVTAAAVASVAR